MTLATGHSVGFFVEGLVMAKKDAYYFQHDANALHDPKIMKLCMNMEMEGYGIWWVFLEMCRNENTGDEPYTIEASFASKLLKRKCCIDESKADTFIQTCKAVGLIVEENGRLFSESFVKRMNEIDIMRDKRKSNGAKGGKKQNASKTQAKPKQNGSSIVKNKIEENIDSNDTKKPKPKFVKPTRDEVAEYIAEKKYAVDADAFMDYQGSVGWKVGNKPMKSWELALATWNRREQKKIAAEPNPLDAFNDGELAVEDRHLLFPTDDEEEDEEFII